MIMRRRSLLILASATAAAPLALAQGKPSIRLVVPFAPGGATDIVARTVAELLSRELGQTIVVDNRAGAGGTIGTAEVARARPDGLTLGVATASTHGVNPAVYKKLPYDAVKDFAAVAQLVQAPGVMVVPTALGIKDYASFLALVKASPGKYTYASAGNGAVSHMWAELFKSATRTDILHVPYKGAAPAVTALLTGEVQLYFDQLASSLPHIRSGRLTPLAVSWPTRLKSVPDTPTFAEVSLPSNNIPSWFGIVAPAGTPADTVKTLHDAIAKVLQDPGLVESFAARELFPTKSSSAEFAAVIRDEVARMRQVAGTAKIQLD